ncbi:MgtC/SapB family protein [Terriglobus albidus]|uniref:MgtC/SapB family protein n=1 Tax=Terriglobus albidus TaxID=1592106 RepID=UPI0021E07E05|nr:MgtC/SapB family protein [Terriglobus albidus]
MHTISWQLTLQFTFRLLLAFLLGAIVGLERQWRHRMAGTRTNALVAGGASAFVMSALLIPGDPSAAGRIASYVVSGVGFLGAGVIFKDGANVRGLNTAATIWCCAAIGVLSGFGAPILALLLTITVVLTNILLRPLAHLLHPVLTSSASTEATYEISLNCRPQDEAHLRALLLGTIAQTTAILQSLHSEDTEPETSMQIKAVFLTTGRHTDVAEEIVRRLSFESSVSAINWTLQTAHLE